LPFTISHAIVAYPLKKIGKSSLSTSGLVVGSMLPDFEYYARMSLIGGYGHDPRFVFTLGLLIGLLILYIYHNLIRDVFISHLPDFFQSRLGIFIGFEWNEYFSSNWMKVILSMLLGISTHFLWDGFTHGPEQFAFVDNTFLMLEYKGMKMYEWHFWVGSIFGLLFIGLLFLRIKPKPIIGATVGKKRVYWIVVLLLFIVITYIRYIYGISDYQIYIQYLVISMSAMGLSILFTSLVFQNLLRNET